MGRHTKTKDGGACIELLPGEPVQVFPRRLPRLPPDNFIDRNDYCFKLVSGQMRLRGIELRPGWEHWPVTPGKLSCYHKKGEEIMSKPTGRPKREAPAKEELLALFERHEGKIERIRKELGCSWLDAKKMLVAAGIINTFGEPIEQENKKIKQTQPPESDQAAEKEPAENSIPYSVERLENIGRELELPEDILKNMDVDAQLETFVNTFTAADEEPTPYTPVENPFDLNRFKIAVLEIFREVAATNQAPDYVTLAFINAIIDVYPEVD